MEPTISTRNSLISVLVSLHLIKNEIKQFLLQHLIFVTNCMIKPKWQNMQHLCMNNFFFKVERSWINKKLIF